MKKTKTEKIQKKQNQYQKVNHAPDQEVKANQNQKMKPVKLQQEVISPHHQKAPETPVPEIE